MKNKFFNNFNYYLDCINKILTIFGILTGVYWYFVTREGKPRAEIKQTVNYSDFKDKRLVHVIVSLENTGKIPFTVSQEKTDIYPIIVLKNGIPELKQKIDDNNQNIVLMKSAIEGKRNLGADKNLMLIEVGEKDYFDWTFLLPKAMTSIRAYSYIGNPTKKNMGWHDAAFIDFTKRNSAPISSN